MSQIAIKGEWDAAECGSQLEANILPRTLCSMMSTGVEEINNAQKTLQADLLVGEGGFVDHRHAWLSL